MIPLGRCRTSGDIPEVGSVPVDCRTSDDIPEVGSVPVPRVGEGVGVDSRSGWAAAAAAARRADEVVDSLSDDELECRGSLSGVRSISGSDLETAGSGEGCRAANGGVRGGGLSQEWDAPDGASGGGSSTCMCSAIRCSSAVGASPKSTYRLPM